MNEDPMYKAFYLRKTNPKKRPYEEVYNETMNEILEYYNKHGKDGFLSERIRKEDISEIAERRTKMKRYDEECSLVMEVTIIDRDKEDEQKKNIEAMPNFARWVTQDDIQIIPRKEDE